MSTNELNVKVKTYFEILEEIEALQQQAENVKALVMEVMTEKGVEKLSGPGWSSTWHNTTTSRFDSKAFKAADPETYNKFCKTTTGTRFTLQQVKTA